MPMDFPDMKSLIDAAEVHGFRLPYEHEDVAGYRTAVANHVAKIDFVESEEIRNGKGWDKFSPSENLMMLRRRMTK